MKSMLHEASTVIKAVEKAWVESGKPREFTVTVLEAGEKNFLGFTKRPAVVSISYEPQRAGARPQAGRDMGGRQKPGVRVGNERRFENPTRSGSDQNRQRVVVRDLAQEKSAVQQPQQQQPVQQQQEIDQWTAELSNDIRGWLSELVTLLECNVPFTYKFDKRVLTITFEKNVLPTSEDERLLFGSFAYVLMQLLKKKHKKKFRGYHLVLTSKRHATNELPQ